MKRFARAAVALALVALAGPALACGFEKQTTTTAAPASAPTVAKAEKSKAVKAVRTQKAKAPPAAKVATSN